VQDHWLVAPHDHRQSKLRLAQHTALVQRTAPVAGMAWACRTALEGGSLAVQDSLSVPRRRADSPGTVARASDAAGACMEVHPVAAGRPAAAGRHSMGPTSRRT